MMKLSNQCRVCGKDLYTKNALTIKNIPQDAQSFSPTRHKKETTQDLAIRQCSGCGLAQINNPPVHYYKNVIRANAFSKDMLSFRQKQLVLWRKKYLSKKSKVLEIGSGKGEYLELMNGLGINAFGIENSRANIRDSAIAQKIEQGYFNSKTPLLKNGLFDAFVSFNFMEHWPDPSSVFNALKKNLTSDAIGLIEVPNFDMMIEKNMYSEFIPDHLFYFTQDTLKRTLELNGFDVINISSIWSDYILSAEIKSRKQMSFNYFQIGQRNLKTQLIEFLKTHKKSPIVVWGAGHQALSTISMHNISTRIAYIVDSAPFKQNKFAPGCNLLVNPPEQLSTDHIMTLIIMGAGYSDEILKIVQKKYTQIQNIAILREDYLEIIHV
jgi:2-polyprenyl-3-methyl-5-hydroxy-6-metoxy-1,4-benzoquinol methylase